MQKKTKYCNSLVSKVLPTINEIGDNNLIFNQIDNSLCFECLFVARRENPFL